MAVGDDASTRVVLRPLATALPLGVSSFGVGMLLLGGIEVGWIATSERATVGILVAAFVFPLELVAAVMAFLERDALAATVLGLFATSWLAQGLVDVTSSSGATSDAVGLFLLGFAVPIAGAGIIGLAAKPLISAVLALSTARSVVAGLWELTGGGGLEMAAGIGSLALAALAGYVALALLAEDARSGAVLPVFRRGAAATAFDGEREPGVREQL